MRMTRSTSIESLDDKTRANAWWDNMTGNNSAASPVFKILFILVVFVFLCGLQVVCKVEKYAFNIVEKGTRVNEEVEVDEDEQTEVIRVPKHNDVDAVELLNDFNAGLSARRYPETQNCYVSKLDTTLPSPRKLKLDMDQASRQTALPKEVTTKSSVVRVVDFADRSALPEKILKFCGTFPIYEVEIEEIPSDALNTTLASGRVREKRTHSFPKFYGLCSHSERSRLEACLKKKGHNELAENHLVCLRNKIVIACFYLISCDHVDSNSAVYNYTCTKIYHQRSYVAKCCGVLGC